MPMQIGLDYWRADDTEWFQELGATWTKLNLSAFDAGLDKGFEKIVNGACDIGLNVIADLRPTDEMQQAIMRLQVSTSEEEAAEALARWKGGIAENVRAYGDRVAAWEIWGEFACPHAGGFYPSALMTYPVLLKAAHETITEIDPEAQVWTGGYGVDFDRSWLDGILEADPECASFTAQNWHHYNRRFFGSPDPDGYPQVGEPLHKRIAYSAGLYRDLFRAVNADCRRPLVSSEWGLHVVSDKMVEASRYIGLFSFTCDAEIPALGDTEAAQYIDAWLEVFEQAGMEVLVYHRLRDSTSYGPDHVFWGNFCGLLYEDGTPKPETLAVVKRWCGKQWA